MDQDQYVKVNIKESTRTKLKDQARAKRMTLADYIEWLGANVPTTTDEADIILEKLDRQAEEPHVDPLIANLEPDELPECCQGIYSGSIKDRCEHWVDKRPAGFYNTLTRKWASDPDYYKYV